MATSQAPVKVTLGSVQYWPVKILSSFGTITTLDGLDVRYDLYKADDDETEIITNASADNDGMIALPLVDSTGFDEGLYKVFISFVATPQTPKLGPFYFMVGD